MSVRGIVRGCAIMALVYALTAWLLLVPHHICDPLTPLPWLHCR